MSAKQSYAPPPVSDPAHLASGGPSQLACSWRLGKDGRIVAEWRIADDRAGRRTSAEPRRAA